MEYLEYMAPQNLALAGAACYACLSTLKYWDIKSRLKRGISPARIESDFNDFSLPNKLLLGPGTKLALKAYKE